jgi:hypothetical protein
MLTPEAEMWISTGERCAAAETLFTYCAGVDVLSDWGEGYPTTVDDLRRCRLLLEQCPELRPRMRRLGYISKHWAELVSFWDDLCAIHSFEDPTWREKAGRAKNTQRMLEEILARAKPTN